MAKGSDQLLYTRVEKINNRWKKVYFITHPVAQRGGKTETKEKKYLSKAYISIINKKK